MSLDELKKQFLVDEDVVKSRLENLLKHAIQHCVVDKKGGVHINNSALKPKDRIKLILVARYLAAQLDAGIPPNLTVAELSRLSGVPNNQVRARASELIDKDRFAEAAGTGSYRALPHKVEGFLLSLGKPQH